jgi:choline-glycine betaine transporter
MQPVQGIQLAVQATVAGAKPNIKHMDAQFSINGGVLLHTSGTLTIQVWATIDHGIEAASSATLLLAERAKLAVLSRSRSSMCLAALLFVDPLPAERGPSV